MLLVSLSANLSSVSLRGQFGLIDVPPLSAGHVLLLFCLPRGSLLDARHIRSFLLLGSGYVCVSLTLLEHCSRV